MHHETSRNSTKPNESGQGAIGLRQGSGVTGLTAAAQGPYLGERRDGEPVRRKAGGLAPGAICGLLVVVVVMTCKWCVDEDYATREVEMRWAWRGRERGARTLGGGDGEEGGTAPAVERRRGEGEREGPGGGGDRGGRDGLHGRRRREGERWGVQA